jgi:hypothetical protein
MTSTYLGDSEIMLCGDGGPCRHSGIAVHSDHAWADH